MAGKVFINYRRDDTKGEAIALHAMLTAHLPGVDLSMDVDGGIPAGESFIRVLEERVAGSDVFLVLIGEKWVTTLDEDGNRRLDNLKDFVRLEIEAALKRDIPIIPILVEQASMPRENQLPDTIRLLAVKQALHFSHKSFKPDAATIAKVIREKLGGGKSHGGVPRWLVAASVAVAMALGATGGPRVMQLAGVDLLLPGGSNVLNEELKRQFGTADEDRRKAVEGRGEALAALQSARDEQKGLNARIQQLAAEKSSAEDVRDRLQSEAARMGAEVDRLRLELDRARGTITMSTNDRSKEIAQLQSQLADTQKNLKLAEAAAKDANAKLADLGRAKDVVDKAKAALEADVAGLRRQLSTSEAAKQQAETQRNDANAKLAEANRGKEAAENAKRGADGELARLRPLVDKGKTDAADLKTSREQIAALRDQIQASESARSLLSQNTKSLRDDLDKASAATTGATKELAETKAKLGLAENQAKAARERLVAIISGTMAEHKGLRRRFDELEGTFVAIDADARKRLGLSEAVSGLLMIEGSGPYGLDRLEIVTEYNGRAVASLHDLEQAIASGKRSGAGMSGKKLDILAQSSGPTSWQPFLGGIPTRSRVQQSTLSQPEPPAKSPPPVKVMLSNGRSFEAQEACASVSPEQQDGFLVYPGCYVDTPIDKAIKTVPKLANLAACVAACRSEPRCVALELAQLSKECKLYSEYTAVRGDGSDYFSGAAIKGSIALPRGGRK